MLNFFFKKVKREWQATALKEQPTAENQTACTGKAMACAYPQSTWSARHWT